MLRTIAVAGLAGILAAGLIVLPVAAAPPSNDEFADALAVALGVPVGPIDTTEATGSPDDPTFPECAFTEPIDHSVWFTWTPGPGEGGHILAHTFGSSYDTTLIVVTGSPGAFELVDCNDDAGSLQSAVQFVADEGVTYAFMVDTFADSPGGSLTFTVQVAPPPVVMEVEIDPTGRKTNDGRAFVSGTIACSREVAFADVEVFLRQRAGRAFIDGFGFVFVDGCGPTPTAWTAEIVGNGIYAGGWADAAAFAVTCELTCAEAFVEARIKLRGG